MAQGMNSTCKAFIAEQLVVGEQRSRRFCDLFDQLVWEGKIGTPLQRQIVQAKRGLSAPPAPLLESTAEDKSAEVAEVAEASTDWAGVSI